MSKVIIQQDGNTKYSLRTQLRVVDAQLTAMNANPHEFLEPMPQPLPELPESALGHNQGKGRKRQLPASLMDAKKARVALDAIQAQIDEQKEEFECHLEDYNACKTVVDAKSKHQHGPGFAFERDLQRAICEAMESYRELVRLQSEIFQQEQRQMGFLKGKMLVDEDEWWREYDDLWRLKLEIQQKLVNGSA